MTRHDPQVRIRHMLDHAREAVDPGVLWDIVTLDLPPLIAQLQSILESQDQP